MPQSTLRKVVFPQPDGPTIIVSSPKRTSRFTPLSAATAESPVPKVFVTPRASMATDWWPLAGSFMRYLKTTAGSARMIFTSPISAERQQMKRMMTPVKTGTCHGM